MSNLTRLTKAQLIERIELLEKELATKTAKARMVHVKAAAQAPKGITGNVQFLVPFGDLRVCATFAVRDGKPEAQPWEIAVEGKAVIENALKKAASVVPVAWDSQEKPFVKLGSKVLFRKR